MQGYEDIYPPSLWTRIKRNLKKQISNVKEKRKKEREETPYIPFQGMGGNVLILFVGYMFMTGNAVSFSIGEIAILDELAVGQDYTVGTILFGISTYSIGKDFTIVGKRLFKKVMRRVEQNGSDRMEKVHPNVLADVGVNVIGHTIDSVNN